MRRTAIAISTFLLAGSVAALSEESLRAPQPVSQVTPKKTQFGTWGIDLDGMDRSVKP